MASEKTPLLPKLPDIELDAEKLPRSFGGLGGLSLAARETTCQRVFSWHHTSLVRLAFKYHWVTICSAMLSALLCVSLGLGQGQLIDSSIMKVYLVLLGFLLGFRNSNANQRRVDAMSNIQQFMGSIWALYIVMPADSREKMRKHFAVAIRAVVQQMPVRSNDFSGWFTLSALHPMDRSNPVVDGKIPVVLSARSLLVAALQFSEAEVHRVETGRDQSLARNLYYHRDKILDAYDGIVMCALPAVSARYLAFGDLCLFFYLVTFPWGLNLYSHSIQFAGWHFVIPSAVARCSSVLFAAVIVCGLEALTRENEDPLEYCTQDADDIEVRGLGEVFEEVSACFEKRAKCLAQQELPAGQRDSDNADIEAATDQLLRVCDDTPHSGIGDDRPQA